MSGGNRRSIGMACATIWLNGRSCISTAGRPRACLIGSRSAFRPSTTESDCSRSDPNAFFTSEPFEKLKNAPLVSAPERALLEVLSEVGVRQPQQEARELVESTYNLRADVLRELLRRCTSIKTVRLCLQLGREQSLPWVAKLNPARLPTGSDRPWVSRSADGVLVLKP